MARYTILQSVLIVQAYFEKGRSNQNAYRIYDTSTAVLFHMVAMSIDSQDRWTFFFKII